MLRPETSRRSGAPGAHIPGFVKKALSLEYRRARYTTGGDSTGLPLGSGSGQSSRFAPGTTGHSSPHPIVIRTWTPLARVCGQLLRARVGEVDAELAHDRYDFAVNALAGRPP